MGNAVVISSYSEDDSRVVFNMCLVVGTAIAALLIGIGIVAPSWYTFSGVSGAPWGQVGAPASAAVELQQRVSERVSDKTTTGVQEWQLGLWRQCYSDDDLRAWQCDSDTGDYNGVLSTPRTERLHKRAAASKPCAVLCLLSMAVALLSISLLTTCCCACRCKRLLPCSLVATNCVASHISYPLHTRVASELLRRCVAVLLSLWAISLFPASAQGAHTRRSTSNSERRAVGWLLTTLHIRIIYYCKSIIIMHNKKK